MPTFKDLQTNLPKLKKNKNPPSLVKRDVYVTVDGAGPTIFSPDYPDDIYINVTTDQAANTVNITSQIQPKPDPQPVDFEPENPDNQDSYTIFYSENQYSYDNFNTQKGNKPPENKITDQGSVKNDEDGNDLTQHSDDNNGDNYNDCENKRIDPCQKIGCNISGRRDISESVTINGEYKYIYFWGCSAGGGSGGGGTGYNTKNSSQTTVPGGCGGGSGSGCGAIGHVINDTHEPLFLDYTCGGGGVGGVGAKSKDSGKPGSAGWSGGDTIVKLSSAKSEN